MVNPNKYSSLIGPHKLILFSDWSGGGSVEMLSVISAFDVPRLTFNVERKKYLADNISNRSEPKLLADAGNKSLLFLDR